MSSDNTGYYTTPSGGIDLDNEEFRQAWRVLTQTNSNLFLTGKAGTGKSTFLKYICNHTTKNHVILAPTGVAAVNVGGMTIHSFFQVPLHPVVPDDPSYSMRNFLRNIKYKRDKRELMKKLDLIVIDEVSMVRADIIDFIDRALRAVTGRRKEPFGGKQLLLVGDVFQLEPVLEPSARPILENYYPDPYFFEAKAFRQVRLISVELKKIYRQKDASFIGMLDRIRTNRVTTDDIRRLNSRSDNTGAEPGKFKITLTSRRDTADAINRLRMEANPNPSFRFTGEIKETFPESMLPTAMELELKEGAQVMLIRNDKAKRWVNGTIARIYAISEKNITICLEDGKEYELEKETWDNIKYSYDSKARTVNQEVIGSFTQYPLKAAWAITIHKSQGLTFSKVAIDMEGGAFSPGQTYVALSRCTSLEGLTISTPLTPRDVIVSGSAVKFSRSYNNRADVELAVAGSRADRQFADAKKAFAKGDFRSAVDSFYQAMCLRNDMARPGMRRLLASELGVINKLRSEIDRLEEEARSLAAEYVQLGDMCLEEDELEAAMRNYDKSLSIRADVVEASLGKAQVLLKENRKYEAMEIVRPLAKTKGNASFRINMLKGEIHRALDEPDRALMSYKKALKIDRNNAPLHRLLADIYERLDVPELADFHLAEARRLENPE